MREPIDPEVASLLSGDDDDHGEASVDTSVATPSAGCAPDHNTDDAFHRDTTLTSTTDLATPSDTFLADAGFPTTTTRSSSPTLAPVATANAAAQPSFAPSTAPVTIADGATVAINWASAQAVTFSGATGALVLNDALAFTGQVSGLTGSDALDLADVRYGANTTATFSGNTEGGTLTVTNGTQTANITLVGDYLSSYWTVSNDGNGGTLVIDPTSSSTWQPVNIGAGGYLTGLDVAPDGVMVVRTDTYGAYIWNGSQWQQLITASSMPAGFVTVLNSNSYAEGVYEIQIAPSNSNIMYMMWDGYVFTTSNEGTTWTETSFSQVNANSQSPYRMYGQKMAIDPNNPDIVYVGTPLNGLFVTTNGGTSWQSVSAVPKSLTDSSGNSLGITGIEFDPANTNIIFAASAGNGVYETNNAGASWSKLSGGPSEVHYAAISSTGIYCAIDNSGNLWDYNGATWTELLAGSSVTYGIDAVAVDPANPNEIIVNSYNGGLNESLNGGISWSGWANNTTLSTADAPWQARLAPWQDPDALVFNPLNPNELFSTGQNDFWQTTIPQTITPSTSLVWTANGIGIEQLVANEIIVPPGGEPIFASWDRGFFTISSSSLGVSPSTFGPEGNSNLSAGWSVDYASSDPSFIVEISDGAYSGSTTEESGYSTNGGQTWTLFATDPPGVGTGGAYSGPWAGSIAASTPDNILWAPSNGNQPYYTLNGGQTWNPVVLPGVSSWSGFQGEFYSDDRDVTADRVLSNTFYLVDDKHGVYRSTNGGVSWTQVYAASPTSGPFYYAGTNESIQSVPGEAGNLFYTPGIEGQPNDLFYQSTNGGVTWNAVANVDAVDAFGFGAPAPGQSYPAIYIAGWVNGVYGIWQSINDAQSWTQIGTYPDGSLNQIQTISGDPNIYGQVYIGFQGSGYAYLSASASTAPAAPVISSGVENSNELVTLTGTAPAGSTVTVSDGGSSALGTTTASSSGGWSFTTADLSSGTYAFTATDTTSAGTSAASSALDVTVPLPAAPAISSGTVNANDSVTLTGTAPDGATVTVSDGGSSALGTTTTSSSGSWSFTTADLSSGTYAFTATDTTSAGTSAASSALDVTVPLPAAPAISSGTVNANDSATLTGTAPDGATVTVSDGGSSALGTTTASSSGSWSFTTADLSSGTYAFTATDTTSAGTSAASSALDVTVPHPAAPAISSGTVNANDSVTLTGTAPDGATVTVSDGGSSALGTTTASSSGSWSFATADLSSGTYAFTATDTTSAGTSGASSPFDVVVTNPANPVVSSIAESPSSGDLDAGKTVTLTLSFNAPVTVTGTPTLTLNDGGIATYTDGSGTSALNFNYTVGSTDSNVSALAATGVNLPNGATVEDGGGNVANLSLTGLTQTGPQIDTTIPAVSSVAESPSSGLLNVGNTVTLTLNLSEVVTVTGTPTLTLNDGGIASYTDGSGTSALNFNYTVGSTDSNVSALAATGVNLPNGATVEDGGGNVANLSLTGLTQTGPQIDTTIPAVSSVAESPSSGVLNVGNTVTLTLNLSEVVTVTGTPTLTLNDGGIATYTDGSGTSALNFNYTVGSTDSNVSALAATGVNLPNGATVEDGGGNVANLSLTGLTQTGPQIDTAIPAVSSVAESPSSGVLNVGNTVTLTLNLSEVVTVTGTPTLTLNDGGIATYTDGSGTSALNFNYTVGSTDSNVSALAATGVNLPNGATVEDGGGNVANLSLTGLTQTGPQIDTTIPDPDGPEPPGLTITSDALTVNAGGSVSLPISVTGVDSDDTISVRISGLTRYETVTDNLDNITFWPKHHSVTLAAAEVNSGLTLNSTYGGTGQPVNTLTVTATNSTAGETGTSAARTITVTDPPANSSGSGHPVNTLTVTASNKTRGETGNAAQTIGVTDPLAGSTSSDSTLTLGAPPASVGNAGPLAALLTQYAAAGFQSESKSGSGGGAVTTTPNSESPFDHHAVLTKPMH